MIMKHFYLLQQSLFAFILLCLAACSSMQKETVKTLTVAKTSTDNIAMSEISSSVKTVALKTSDSLLIGSISKIMHQGNIIYLSDGNALYKFNNNGKFMGKIDKKGDGPDEYKGISDFQIDSNNDVWILSRKGKQLSLFGWDGSMKNSIKLNNLVSTICLLSDKTMYLFSGNETDGDNNAQIKRLNLQTKQMEESYLPINSKKAQYLFVKSPNHFNRAQSSDKAYFFDIFNDTVYQVTEANITPAYYIDINKKNIPSSFFDSNYENIMVFFQALFKHDYAYGTAIFGESGKNYIVSYFYNKQRHLALINKNNSKTKDFIGINNDVDLMNYPIALTGDKPFFIQNDNELIFALQPSEIIDYAEQNPAKVNLDKLKQTIKYTGVDQNPIVVFAKMK